MSSNSKARKRVRYFAPATISIALVVAGYFCFMFGLNLSYDDHEAIAHVFALGALILSGSGVLLGLYVFVRAALGVFKQQGLGKLRPAFAAVYVAVLVTLPSMVLYQALYRASHGADAARAGMLLREVAQAMLTYHNSLGDPSAFPHDRDEIVRALLAGGYLQQEQLGRWPAKKGVEPLFYYVHGDVSTYDTNQVVLFENPEASSRNRGGCWIAFADIHVEYRHAEECAAIVQRLFDNHKVSPAEPRNALGAASHNFRLIHAGMVFLDQQTPGVVYDSRSELVSDLLGREYVEADVLGDASFGCVDGSAMAWFSRAAAVSSAQELPVLFTNSACWEDGRGVVLFNDGHTEVIEADVYQRVFGELVKDGNALLVE